MELADSMRLFCEHLADKYGNPGAVSEEIKAGEFRSYFVRDLPVNVPLLRLVASACGYPTEALESGRMPDNLRGFHEMTDSRQRIYYREEDSQSGIQNTLLHEIREIMEPGLAAVSPGYKPLRTRAVHQAANRFAAAVLLPRADFLEQIYRTGFDVAALSQHYSKSCSQILLRMGEVLQDKLFFYGSLYSPEPENPDRWAADYCTRSIGPEKSAVSLYNTRGFFPRRGRAAKPGSFVDLTIKTVQSHLVRYVIRRGSREPLSLIMLAQPQVVASTPVRCVHAVSRQIHPGRAESAPVQPGGQAASKVAVVALPAENQKLLAPQIERTRPVVLETVYHPG